MQCCETRRTSELGTSRIFDVLEEDKGGNDRLFFDLANQPSQEKVIHKIIRV